MHTQDFFLLQLTWAWRWCVTYCTRRSESVFWVSFRFYQLAGFQHLTGTTHLLTHCYLLRQSGPSAVKVIDMLCSKAKIGVIKKDGVSNDQCTIFPLCVELNIRWWELVGYNVSIIMCIFAPEWGASWNYRAQLDLLFFPVGTLPPHFRIFPVNAPKAFFLQSHTVGNERPCFIPLWGQSW
jgi:hypothetical protein